MTRFTLLAAAALLLMSCGGNDPVAEEAENTAGLPSIDNVAGGRDGTPSADGGAPPNATATPDAQGSSAFPPNPDPAAAIPAALHGRWGMTPADCTSTRGDAKGLLVISSDGLRFYESRAVPVRNVESSKDSIRADFAFTGEGQTWTKFQTLSLEDDKLIRTESSPMASFIYARCR
jgi:hypothetical protein